MAKKAVKKPVKAAKKAAKATTIWRSKEAKRAYWLFGIPVVAILVWYFYTVAFEFNKPAMSKMEKQMADKVVKLTERAIKEGFKPEDVDKCQHMIKEYTTPKGWNYSNAELYQLVGLSRRATQEQMNERCIFYAKAVAEMEKLSHHTRHVFVCGKSILDLGGKGKFYVKADPKGRGVIKNLDGRSEKLQKIGKGRSTVIDFWQVYNVGDGCVIVGMSKAGTFRFSGTVRHE